MNKQIREMAIEAGAVEAKYITNIPGALSLNGEEIQEFAESIIRECITRIETHEIPLGNSAAGEIACEMTYSALKQIRRQIKEHFGVK